MFFSKELYFQGIKKIRSIGIGAAVTTVVINFLYAWAEFESKSSPDGIERLITGGSIAPFTFVLLFFSFFIVNSCFDFLNERKASDFYHSIPHKRICVYTSLMASVITWVAAIAFSTILLNFSIFTLSSSLRVSVGDALLTFVGYTVSALVVIGVCSICRMISGSTVSFVAYTACFLAVPRIINYLFQYMLTIINPSIVFEKVWIKALTMEKSFYFVFYEAMENQVGNFGDPLLLISLFLEALIFIAFGAYLYARRKSQIAGQSPSTALNHFLFRSAVTIPLVLYALIALVLGKEFMSFFIFIVLALLAYFLFELILNKNVSKAAKSMFAFVIPVLLSSLIIGIAFLTSKGFNASAPTIEQTKYISIEKNGSWISKPLNEQTGKNFYSEGIKRVIFDSLPHSQKKLEPGFVYEKILIINFTTNDGSVKSRKVYFTLEEYNLLVSEIEKVY